MIERNQINFVINPSALRKGDILLLNTNNPSFQAKIESELDHVAIYMGDSFILEADGLGVVMSSIFSYGFRTENDAIVLRSKNASDAQLDAVVFFARAKLGMEFGGLEMGRVPQYENTESLAVSPYRMICTRLAAQAYHYAGIHLVHNPDYCRPQSFSTSPELERVDNVMLKADEEFRNQVMRRQEEKESGEDAEVQSSLLQKMSELYGCDIQSFVQVLEQGLAHPELDEKAIDVFEGIHYFDNRYHRERKMPWLDSDSGFLEHFPTTDRRMYFLVYQDIHLQKTFYPCVEQNCSALKLLIHLSPDSKLLHYVSDGFCRVLEDLDYIEKRLVDLLELCDRTDHMGCESFLKEKLKDL